LPSELFPYELLYPHLQELIDANKMLAQLVEDYKKTPPGQVEAFECALRLESIAAEQHFQHFMDLQTPDSKITEMFQMLNSEDKDHIFRIQNFMEQHSLS